MHVMTRLIVPKRTALLRIEKRSNMAFLIGVRVLAADIIWGRNNTKEQEPAQLTIKKGGRK